MVSVLLLVTWGASLRGSIAWEHRNGLHVWLRPGQLLVGVRAAPMQTRLLGLQTLTALSDPVIWWFYWYRSPIAWQVGIPLWTFAVVALAITALAWRLDTLARRRARVGYCPQCSYDRTGLAVAAVCPECGRPPS